MEWELMLELAIGGVSTLLAVGVQAWLSRHPARIWSLVAPVVWLLCLALGSAVAQRMIGEHPVIITLTYIAIALGGMRLAFVVAPTRRSALIVIGMIGAVAVLTLFELREPIVKYLDSFTFSVGETRVSLLKIFEAIVLLAILFWVTHAVHHWLSQYIRRLHRFDPTAREWLVKLSELALYVVVLIWALNLVGIDITTLAVFGGAVGVSLGLGLQKIVSNYVCGLILLFEKTIRVGDVIELEGGLSGHVYRLEPRGTFILCTDGKEVIVPNDEFITKTVTNYTYSDQKGQISIPICIAYGTDVEHTRDLLIEAAIEHPLCLTFPEPKCYIREFGSYAIHMLLQFWVADIRPGSNGTQSDVMFAILRKLKAAGIEIPTQYVVAE